MRRYRHTPDLNQEHEEKTGFGAHWRRRRGFTLVELMVGLLALTIVLAGAFSGLS